MQWLISGAPGIYRFEGQLRSEKRAHQREVLIEERPHGRPPKAAEAYQIVAAGQRQTAGEMGRILWICAEVRDVNKWIIEKEPPARPVDSRVTSTL
jgi:hypothetical protein